MEKRHREVLQERRPYLVENLRVADIANHLLEKNTVTIDHFEQLTTSTLTNREKVNKLLEILPQRGPQAYQNFIIACKNGDHRHVAEELGRWERRRRPKISLNEAEFDYQALADAQRLCAIIMQEILHAEDPTHNALHAPSEPLAQLLEQTHITDDLVTSKMEHYTRSVSNQSLNRPLSDGLSHGDNVGDNSAISLLVHDVIVHMTVRYEVDPRSSYSSDMIWAVEEFVMLIRPTVSYFFETLDRREGQWKEDIKAVIDKLLKNCEWTWLHVVIVFTICGLFATHVVICQSRITIVEITQFLEEHIEVEFESWIETQNGWNVFLEVCSKLINHPDCIFIFKTYGVWTQHILLQWVKSVGNTCGYDSVDIPRTPRQQQSIVSVRSDNSMTCVRRPHSTSVQRRPNSAPSIVVESELNIFEYLLSLEERLGQPDRPDVSNPNRTVDLGEWTASQHSIPSIGRASARSASARSASARSASARSASSRSASAGSASSRRASSRSASAGSASARSASARSASARSGSAPSASARSASARSASARRASAGSDHSDATGLLSPMSSRRHTWSELTESFNTCLARLSATPSTRPETLSGQGSVDSRRGQPVSAARKCGRGETRKEKERPRWK